MLRRQPNNPAAVMRQAIAPSCSLAAASAFAVRGAKARSHTGCWACHNGKVWVTQSVCVRLEPPASCIRSNRYVMISWTVLWMLLGAGAGRPGGRAHAQDDPRSVPAGRRLLGSGERRRNGGMETTRGEAVMLCWNRGFIHPAGCTCLMLRSLQHDESPDAVIGCSKSNRNWSRSSVSRRGNTSFCCVLIASSRARLLSPTEGRPWTLSCRDTSSDADEDMVGCFVRRCSASRAPVRASCLLLCAAFVTFPGCSQVHHKRISSKHLKDVMQVSRREGRQRLGLTFMYGYES